MAEASFFNEAYEGQPPWDIGRPQKEIVRLAHAGEIKGDVLDAGCGTGENALYLAELGHEVVGIDSAPRAIDKARAKARERNLQATFLIGDALDLDRLGRQFDTVVDCGLFHVLSDEQRPLYTSSLHASLRPGRAYFMLCFSERQPGSSGPRRVTQAEIRSTFSQRWQINYIREATLETNMGLEGVRAWLASITRL